MYCFCHTFFVFEIFGSIIFYARKAHFILRYYGGIFPYALRFGLDENAAVFLVYNCILGVPRDHPAAPDRGTTCRSESRSSILKNTAHFCEFSSTTCLDRNGGYVANFGIGALLLSREKET